MPVLKQTDFIKRMINVMLDTEVIIRLILKKINDFVGVLHEQFRLIMAHPYIMKGYFK